MAMLSRRKFIGIAGGLGATGVAGTAAWSALLREHADEAAPATWVWDKEGVVRQPDPTHAANAKRFDEAIAAGNEGRRSGHRDEVTHPGVD